MSSSRSRGQMTAPVELFIAVIIMTISMGIALSIYNGFDNTQCEFQQKTQNENLQEKMQEVAIGSWGTSKVVDYVMERCPQQSTVAVRIVHYSDPQYCRTCSGNYGNGCWLIEPMAYTPDGTLSPIDKATVCVELSESLKLSIDNSASCNGVVTQSACPTKDLAGNPISGSDSGISNDCAKLLKVNPDTFANTDLVTFEPKSSIASPFTIRITKGASSGDITSQAGTLSLCVSQT
jgi:type II secretory pathway pseudopilin PulG